jgi:EpsD family peptidyl-prolyl cis-trans isomerase
MMPCASTALPGGEFRNGAKMTKSNVTWLAAASICLVLAACGSKNKTPTGQVVANVDGKEVTAIDLRSELGNFSTTDAKVRKAAEMQALDGIISRKLLSQAAEKAGVDKSPGFAQQVERTKEVLLVQTWETQIAKAVPEPSSVEATKFITDHPAMYAGRKLYDVDQIRFPRPSDPEVIKALAPLKSLEEVSALLKSHNIPVRASQDQMDPLNVDPRLFDQIVKLPPGEVFLMPGGNAVIANRIRESRDAPLTGDVAMKHATAYLKAQHTREALQRQFGSILEAGRTKVKFAKAYEPPNAAPPPKPAAPKK